MQHTVTDRARPRVVVKFCYISNYNQPSTSHMAMVVERYNKTSQGFGFKEDPVNNSAVDYLGRNRIAPSGSNVVTDPAMRTAAE